VQVGDGFLTRFWHDILCGDSLLKDSFPELFCLARNRDATVADLRSVSNDTAHSDVNLTRFVHDW
jgi:hypothetical protein